MIRRSRLSLIASMLFIVFVYGCAQVTIRKVPTPTQYTHWTDEMQQEADRMEGIRFYLPRPFLNVFESFPVRTDIYLADGVVSADKKHLIIERVRPESELAKYFAGLPQNNVVPMQNVYVPKRGFAPQGAGENGDPATTDSTAGGLVTSTGAESSGRPPSQHAAPNRNAGTIEPGPSVIQNVTGINKRKTTNDNGAIMYQPMRGNFDLAYLPDFEEQYVVSSRAGLGNAEFEVNLGQGWSLQGFNSLSDNSKLNKRIFDIIDSGINLAKNTIGRKFKLPSTTGGADSTNMFVPQGTGIPPTPVAGHRVSVKIVVVHYAAKGLYPVIKPRELQERMSGKEISYHYLDLFRQNPKVTGFSEFDPNAIERARQLTSNTSSTFTVPKYPYQYVSFNTFRYMAIEVVTPTNDESGPFKHLYDKTGTQGDAGDRQEADLGDILKEMLRRNNLPPRTGKPKQPGIVDPQNGDVARNYEIWKQDILDNVKLTKQEDTDKATKYIAITEATFSPDFRTLSVKLERKGEYATVWTVEQVKADLKARTDATRGALSQVVKSKTAPITVFNILNPEVLTAPGDAGDSSAGGTDTPMTTKIAAYATWKQDIEENIHLTKANEAAAATKHFEITNAEFSNEYGILTVTINRVGGYETVWEKPAFLADLKTRIEESQSTRPSETRSLTSKPITMYILTNEDKLLAPTTP